MSLTINEYFGSTIQDRSSTFSPYMLHAVDGYVEVTEGLTVAVQTGLGYCGNDLQAPDESLSYFNHCVEGEEELVKRAVWILEQNYFDDEGCPFATEKEQAEFEAMLDNALDAANEQLKCELKDIIGDGFDDPDNWTEDEGWGDGYAIFVAEE